LRSTYKQQDIVLTYRACAFPKKTPGHRPVKYEVGKISRKLKVSGQEVETVGAPFFAIRTSPRPLGGDISAVFTDI